MPGVLSASADTLKGKTRNISGYPQAVVGPGARSCGACHRSNAIIEDDNAALAVKSQHFRTFGYSVTPDQGTWATVVDKIMSFFK